MPTSTSLNIFHRLFWPLLSLLICALVWYLVLARAGAEEQRADQQLRREAVSLAEAYEQYLTRSVGQMDQITMQLKHSWEHGNDPKLLESLKRDGMYPAPVFGAGARGGPGGVRRSSTHNGAAGAALQRGGTAFFQEQKN